MSVLRMDKCLPAPLLCFTWRDNIKFDPNKIQFNAMVQVNLYFISALDDKIVVMLARIKIYFIISNP